MKRIDFYEKKKVLHNEMIDAIVSLFEESRLEEINFMPAWGYQTPCWVIVSSGGADTTYEECVAKVRCSNRNVDVLLKGCDEWISCEHGGDIVTDSIDDLYEAVYNVIVSDYE